MYRDDFIFELHDELEKDDDMTILVFIVEQDPRTMRRRVVGCELHTLQDWD